MKKQKSEILPKNQVDNFIEKVATYSNLGYESGTFISAYDYVLFYLNCIPNVISYHSVSTDFHSYLKDNYQLINFKRNYNNNNTLNVNKHLYKKDNVFISVDLCMDKDSYNPSSVCIAWPYNESLDLSFMDKFLVKDTKSNIGIFTKDCGTLVVKQLKIKNYNIDDVDLYYGEGFSKTHDTIVNALKTEESGLYIFNGQPGTGKSSYIRHLSSIIGGDTNFIYVSEQMVGSLSTPDLVDVLLENKGSILILEDAEKHIKSRESTDDNFVSTLLNLTDGLLSDILKIKIIVTYNADNVNIDKALLRKSRLKYKHDFNALSVKDSQRLINHLKLNHTATKPMSLAEIFKINDEFNYKEKEKAKIGF